MPSFLYNIVPTSGSLQENISLLTFLSPVLSGSSKTMPLLFQQLDKFVM